MLSGQSVLGGVLGQRRQQVSVTGCAGAQQCGSLQHQPTGSSYLYQEEHFLAVIFWDVHAKLL